jgi:hypothetical protein
MYTLGKVHIFRVDLNHGRTRLVPSGRPDTKTHKYYILREMKNRFMYRNEIELEARHSLPMVGHSACTFAALFVRNLLFSSSKLDVSTFSSIFTLTTNPINNLCTPGMVQVTTICNDNIKLWETAMAQTARGNPQKQI